MPARTYIVDGEAAAIASALLRLNRERCVFKCAVNSADGKVVILATDDNPECEIRPDRSTDMVTRSWVAHTEQPDTKGGAARVIDEDTIAEAVARWDDPA